MIRSDDIGINVGTKNDVYHTFDRKIEFWWHPGALKNRLFFYKIYKIKYLHLENDLTFKMAKTTSQYLFYFLNGYFSKKIYIFF